MKHLTILLLLLLSVTIMASDFPVEPYSSKPLESELTFVNQWKNFLLQKGEADISRYDAVIPFSFVCGDRSSREWIKPDTATITSGEWLPNRTRKHTLVWKENVTSFVCTMELTEFQDFPALEWLVRLHNAGQSDTPLIHDFNALHTRWDAPGVIMPILHRSIGSPGAEDDFFFQAEMMHNSLWDQKRRLVMDSPTNLHFAQTQRYCIPGDKRTSAVWMPFFNYQTGSDGLITALGWSGSWQAAFDHTGAGKSTISAGLENLNTKLLPDESIRSPLILVLYWQGELMHGQNVCRQFILAHHSPQIDGKLIEPTDVGIVWGGVPTAEHLEFIEGIKKYEIPFNLYHLDAGWYGTGTEPSYDVFHGDWGPMAGDWRPNPNWHNGTLKPISDAAHAADMKFMIWVEPERAIHGRPITLEHPEYFLTGHADGKIRDGQTLLLDLGKPEACDWAISVISNLVDEYGINWYEEDFNVNPNPFLEIADLPERTGMKEMRFTEGFYRFWDTLFEKYPQLAIFNCASGGRRIDLETLTRGQALWRSDYQCFPEATDESTQDQSYGISYWLPIQGTMAHAWMLSDTYQARSALSSGNLQALVKKDEESWRQIKRNTLEVKRAKKYFFGDYYPLTHEQGTKDSWMAYHLYLPSEKKGMLVVLRRPKSDVVSMKFDLLTIDPTKNWQFEDVDSGNTQTLSGKEIRQNGFEVTIPNRRDSRLIFYHAE